MRQQWEIILLQRLNWHLSSVTAFDFVDPLLARIPWGRANPLIRTHALTLLSVCYTVGVHDNYYLIGAIIVCESLPESISFVVSPHECVG
ncbi:hypothetical protein EVAR_51865_1 [Eumeta japonica]|uniref:G1/S-specific cyclin-D2 n=1 Tax=Eumeta variegata TaxID=151549 RepID=A0A4C1YT75_EUMVA|nr:hypothetical protein EVAR_51865_1 [Eumeta japonica]